MKEFAIYTALRLLVFLAVLALVLGVWIKLLGNQGSLLWPLLVSLVVSGGISMFLLDRPRAALAHRVQQRAERAAAKFEEIRARED